MGLSKQSHIGSALTFGAPLVLGVIGKQYRNALHASHGSASQDTCTKF